MVFIKEENRWEELDEFLIDTREVQRLCFQTQKLDRKKKAEGRWIDRQKNREGNFRGSWKRQGNRKMIQYLFIYL